MEHGGDGIAEAPFAPSAVPRPLEHMGQDQLSGGGGLIGREHHERPPRGVRSRESDDTPEGAELRANITEAEGPEAGVVEMPDEGQGSQDGSQRNLGVPTPLVDLKPLPDVAFLRPPSVPRV